MTINEIYGKLMELPKEEIALRLAHMLAFDEKERNRMRNQTLNLEGFAFEYPCDENEAIIAHP